MENLSTFKISIKIFRTYLIVMMTFRAILGTAQFMKCVMVKMMKGSLRVLQARLNRQLTIPDISENL